MNPPASLEVVLRFAARLTGLALADRREAAEAGIRRAMARAGAADPARYLERIGRDADALDDLLSELTVGETYFFREPAAFDFLRRTVLPGLRGRRDIPRAWSAGCATGEEAYSLAILFEQEGLGGRYELLGTDLCRGALERARRGVYRPWSLRGERAAAVRPYLEHVGSLYRVVEGIRSRVTFRALNLARDPYPCTGGRGLDVILCRNVLIYLDRETVRRVADGLLQALAPGGWLLTASSDPPLAEQAPFEVVTAPEGVFYRRGSIGARAAPAGQLVAETAPAFEANTPGEGPFGDGSRHAEPAAPPAESERSPPPPVRSAADEAAQVRAALRRGDYTRAAELTAGFEDDPALAALRVRALTGLDLRSAEQACAAAVSRHPLATEMAYLHAALLVDLGRQDEAAEALRRVLYLDASLAVAHFTLGSVLERLGDADGARRAYRNALDLASARPPDEPLPLAEGESAGHLAEAAAAALAPQGALSGRSP